MRGARGQRQPAACDQIERPHLAPHIENHRAERIAGQSIGGGAQRGFRIRRAHGHQEAWIEAELFQPAHGQRTGFPLRKILPYPDQRSPSGEAMRDTRDKTRRCRAMPAASGEHLMQRAAHEAALQHSIRARMAERHTGEIVRPAFEASNGPLQGRKCAPACAGHAPLLKFRTVILWIERMTDLFVHDMF